MAEWSIAAVLKTVELRGSGGSNPSLSARSRSKKVSRNRYLLFLYLWRKFTCRRRCENKRWRRAAFCAVGLQGPLRRAEGEGVKRSDNRERSSQSLPLRSITKQKGIEKFDTFCFYTSAQVLLVVYRLYCFAVRIRKTINLNPNNVTLCGQRWRSRN